MRAKLIAVFVTLLPCVAACGRSQPVPPAMQEPPPTATQAPPTVPRSPTPVGPAPTEPPDGERLSQLFEWPHEEEKIYDKQLNDIYDLVVRVGFTNAVQGACCPLLIRISLRSRSNPDLSWDIVRTGDRSHNALTIDRADEKSIVLCRSGDYGYAAGCTKFFIDISAKRLIKSIDFTWDDVTFSNDVEAQRTLDVSASELEQLRALKVFSTAYKDEFPPEEPPKPFAPYPFPQSTYREFAKARPKRVSQGYRENTLIKTQVGPWQEADGRLWFGKAFYDGEGNSGIGDIGYLNSEGQYTFLHLPEMVDWSALRLLVEPQTIWVSLVDHGEGADSGGGLLEYDRSSNRAVVHKIPSVIHTMAHVGSAMFLGTTHGLCVVRGGVTTRYSMEPTIGGGFAVMAERLGR